MIADLCKKIKLPEEETRLALHTLKKYGVLCEKLAHSVHKKEKVGVLKKMTMLNHPQGGAISLAVVLLMAEFTKLEYQRRGIPMEIFYATMEDIPIWCKNFKRQHGIPGLDESNWLIHHIKLRLFRLGRLQFMMRPVSLPPLMPKSTVKALPFHRKDPCVDVHIPEGEPLTREACISSFQYAEEFFSSYYPEHHYAYYTCFSWLLSEHNKAILPPESNILRFASLWEVPYNRDDASQAIEHIFGREQVTKREFNEATSLQRAAKAHLIAGKPLGEGYGYRARKADFPK